MEFILFLSKIDKEIIELINKSNHSIEENTSLCLIDKKYVGFYKKRECKKHSLSYFSLIGFRTYKHSRVQAHLLKAHLLVIKMCARIL